MRLISITVVDKGDFDVIYHYDDKGKIVTKKRTVKRNKPITKSITKEYPGAEIFEREAHDLFGVEFEGNKHLHEPVFLPDNYEGKPPFRKEVKKDA